MPSLDKVKIDTETLAEIVMQVHAKKYDGPVVIIDTYDSFTIRDNNDMKIVEVQKSEREKPTT